MQAGRLRHKIVVQQPSNSNVGGVNVETWSTFDTLRADVMPQRGSEYWAAKQVQEKEPKIFIIRYRSGITSKMRVLFSEKAYDIQSVVNVEERNREMHIITTAYDIEYPEFIYSNLSAADDGTGTGKAVITWDTDFYSDSQAFYKKDGDENFTATPLSAIDTDPRVLSHSITTPSLDYDSTYTVKVRGYNEGGYTPGYSDTITVYVSAGGNVSMTPPPAGDIVFSDYSLSKNPILQKVIVDWHTDVETKSKVRSRLKDSGDAWDETTLSLTFSISHSRMTQMDCTPNVYWEFQAYGIMENEYEEWDVLKYVRISAEGLPQFVG